MRVAGSSNVLVLASSVDVISTWRANYDKVGYNGKAHGKLTVDNDWNLSLFILNMSEPWFVIGRNSKLRSRDDDMSRQMLAAFRLGRNDNIFVDMLGSRQNYYFIPSKSLQPIMISIIYHSNLNSSTTLFDILFSGLFKMSNFLSNFALTFQLLFFIPKHPVVSTTVFRLVHRRGSRAAGRRGHRQRRGEADSREGGGAVQAKDQVLNRQKGLIEIWKFEKHDFYHCLFFRTS